MHMTSELPVTNELLALSADEITYDDDEDVKASKPEVPAVPAAAEPAKAPAETTGSEAAPSKTAAEPAPPSTTDAAPTGDNEKENVEGEGAPLFTKNLPPTNPKTEAEKRAARAARFGIQVEEASDDAKLAKRAERFGLGNEQVSALDSALPDRPRKRGRANDEEGGHDGKRQSTGPESNKGQGGGRGQGGQGQGQGGGRNRFQRRRGGNAPRQDNDGQKATKNVVSDPAEQKKREERAKRFAA